MVKAILEQDLKLLKKLLLESFFGKLRVPFYLGVLYFVLELISVLTKNTLLFYLNYILLFALVTFVYPIYYLKWKGKKIKITFSAIGKHYLLYLLNFIVLILPSFLVFLLIVGFFAYYFVNGLNTYNVETFTTALMIQPLVFVIATLFVLILIYSFLFLPLNVARNIKLEFDSALIKSLKELKNLFSFKTFILLALFLFILLILDSITNKIGQIVIMATLGSIFSYFVIFSFYHYYENKLKANLKELVPNLLLSFFIFLVLTYTLLKGKIDKTLFIISTIAIIFSLPFRAINYALLYFIFLKLIFG